jgi:hypothetical protein
MRESEIEEGIMKGGVEECIEEKKPDILLNSFLLESEFTMRASGDGQDDDAGDEEADAGETLYTLIRRIKPVIEQNSNLMIESERGKSYRLIIR